MLSIKNNYTFNGPIPHHTPNISSTHPPFLTPTPYMILFEFCHHTDPLHSLIPLHNEHLTPYTIKFPIPPTPYSNIKKKFSSCCFLPFSFRKMSYDNSD